MKRTGLLLSALFMGACGRPFDLEEAAAVYERNEAQLAEIVSAANEGMGTAELEKRAKRQFRLESLSVFRGDDGVVDSIQFTLKTYGLSISGRAISLWYSDDNDPAEYEAPGNQYFDRCDGTAIHASKNMKGNGAVLCRLSAKWIAVQVSS